MALFAGAAVCAGRFQLVAVCTQLAGMASAGLSSAHLPDAGRQGRLKKRREQFCGFKLCCGLAYARSVLTEKQRASAILGRAACGIFLLHAVFL